jgi:hypothetical protein
MAGRIHPSRGKPLRKRQQKHSFSACAASIPQAGDPKDATPNAQQRNSQNETTIEDVRHYTAKAMPGHTLFKCLSCDYSRTTLEFDSTVGNRRTQAAGAMNRHAAASHPGGNLQHRLVLAKQGGRGAL